MTLTVLRNGRVHTAADPEATALAVTDGTISWLGGEHAVGNAGRPDRVIDLAGALVVPGLTPTSLNVALVQPGTQFNERWTQADLGIRRVFKFGDKSLNADLQAFNAFNTAVMRRVNQTYGSSLGRPTATLDGRVVRLTVTFKF